MLVLPNIQDSPSFDGMAVGDAGDEWSLNGPTLGTGVISGMAVTQDTGSDMKIAVASGIVTVGGTQYTYTGTGSPFTITTASATDRRDVVVYRAGTGIVVIAGTACGTAGWTRTSTGLPPVKPDIVQSTDVILAEIYVASTTTVISTATNVVDKRNLLGAVPLPNGTTATTQTALDNSTKLATTAYTDSAVGVETSRATTAEGLKAPIASPTFTGTVTVPNGAVLGTPTSVTLTNGTGLPESGVTNLTSDLAGKAPLASPALTGTPTAPTASPGTNTTQLATTAFVEAAVVDVPSAYTTSTITANPSPAVIGTYYRCNYASSGSFTLPSTSLTTGQWVKVKHLANNTLTIVGTVDGNASFTLSQYDSFEFIWNGTTWDIN